MQKEVNSDYLLWKRIKAGETQAFHELYMQFADITFFIWVNLFKRSGAYKRLHS